MPEGSAMRSTSFISIPMCCTLGWALCASGAGEEFAEQNGVIAMEAEHYTSQQDFALVADGGASGGEAMQVKSSSGALKFKITLKQGGRWYIYLRTKAKDHTFTLIKDKKADPLIDTVVLSKTNAFPTGMGPAETRDVAGTESRTGK